MKNRGKKVMSGILAAVVAFACLPSDLSAAVIQKETIQEQSLPESGREAEIGEAAAEVLTDQETGKGEEYLTEADVSEEMFAFGSQASELIEDSRQGLEHQGSEKGTAEERFFDYSAAVQQPLSVQGTVQGACGANVSYELDTDTGEVVVSGSGPMTDYERATDSPFYQYGDIITSVTVSEGVTSIGALAFAFCFGAERVYLPNTLVSVGKQAFLGCMSLQAVVVPNQVTEIGDYALGYYCNNGKNGTYQNTAMTIIGTSSSAAAAYAQDKNITFLAVDALTHSCGENVTWAFDLASGVLEISGEGAMADYTVSSYQGEEPEYYPYRDYVTSVTVHAGVASVGAEAFYNFHNLGQIELAESVTAIGRSAFYGCENLQGVLLPASLSTIGDFAFSDCRSLKSVALPQGLSEIGTDLFSGCRKLENIEAAEGNAFFSSYQGVLFDQNQESLLMFPKGYKASSFTVPDTVKSVKRSAFPGGGALKSLIFEGDAPSGFQVNSQNIQGLTIYYDSSRKDWDSLAGVLVNAKVAAKDMLQLKEQNILVIDAPSEQLNMAESMQLEAQISPYLATEFQWSSSDEAVAVVSSQGKVTAVNPGSAEIQAVSADSKYRASITLNVTGEPFVMPSYDIADLTEGLNYTTIYTPTKQILSEELHGIYFLEGKKLGFYSFINKAYQLVETFAGCDDAYAANGNLYMLCDNTCYIYDLSTQSMRFRFEIGGCNATVIGADGQGRVYVGGYDVYHPFTPVVLLFSENGEQLFELPVGTSVRAFAGFDSSNGCFYMESGYDYYSWGYSHPGKGLTMGRAEGNRLRYIDTYYSFLESGIITRSMSCLLYLCQNYYMNHQTSAELIGDRYLVAASVLHSAVYVFDSNSASDSGMTRIMSVHRPAMEGDEEGDTFDLASIGVRTVYNERNNSILIYENNKTITEYSLDTGEKLSSFKTQHQVFHMLKMNDSLLVIEKENDAYYMEILDWGVPTQIQIQAEDSQMQAGSSQELTLESDKDYTSFCQWSSSDDSIVSVTREGKAAAWKEGTAVITAKVSDTLSAELTIHVTASSTVTPTENIVKSKGENSKNYSANNYLTYGKVVYSYLTEGEDESLTRVEYIPEKGVLAEIYSSQFNLLESKTLPGELDYFGGYYPGKNANFLVFGQKNPEESDETEVLRIVKYSKEWERQGQISVKGANTYIPFDAGSLRMAETGNLLYIYTCHEMYAEGDGVHHQANMTFVINEETMEVAQSYYDVMNIAQAGYVSHSFNQFVKTDGSNVFRVDHGDANPRAVSLTKCRVDGNITNVSYDLPFPINGRAGDNATGVSVGGLELSSDHCLIAGNSVDQSSAETYSSYGKRNIFLTVTGKELDFNDIIWLTDYKEDSEIVVRTPYIVKLGQEQFLVLWEEYNNKTKKAMVKMVTVDSQGTKTSDVVETGLRLSDCMPVLTSDGLVKWYVTDSQSVIFCTVNPYNLSAIKGEVVIEDADDNPVCTKHYWSKGVVTKYPTCTKKGVKEYTCTVCGEKKEEAIAKIPHAYETTVTKATTAKNGSITEKCAFCGSVGSRKTIFAVKSATLKTASYAYNGKAKKPSVTVKDSNGKVIGDGNYSIVYKNNVDVGKASAIIRLKGTYAGTLTKNFTIVPQGTSVLGKITAKSKGLIVKWKKQTTSTTGYEIQISTDKKFKKKTTVTKTVKKNSATKLTVNKLKPRKKYYVRVRTYKMVKGKKYGSSWSKEKTVTTKK